MWRQAPSPAFGRGFFTVASQESFAAAEGTSTRAGRKRPGVGDPAAPLLGVPQGLAGIFDRTEEVNLAPLKGACAKVERAIPIFGEWWLTLS